MSQHRHVRRLRFRCVREADARHGRVLLEDALRTATLSDDRQLIVVRRLDLGVISARASATEWSRHLERSYLAARPTPIPFDHPAARTADAVSFPDDWEPWLQLAVRSAAQWPCEEWYWPLAAPTWSPNSSPPETLRLAFRALAARGGLPLTLVLALRLHASGALAVLLRALRSEDISGLGADLTGTSTNLSASAAELAAATLPRLEGEELAIVTNWGADDLRLRWMAAVHLARVAHAPSIARLDLDVMASRIHAVVRLWTNLSTPSRPPIAGPAQSAAKPPSGLTSEPPADLARLAHEPTALGGLFFVVPLLSRAGLPVFLATLPPEERTLYPWHVLRAMARHARARHDDPLWRVLADLPEPGPRVARWLLAANRLARRQARLSLRQLIVRPARVTVSPTHLTVSFRPGDADIRIRCAALDLDLGWVPWLGRTVDFHFNRED